MEKDKVPEVEKIEVDNTFKYSVIDYEVQKVNKIHKVEKSQEKNYEHRTQSNRESFKATDKKGVGKNKKTKHSENKMGIADTENHYKQRTQSDRESYKATDKMNVEKSKKEKHSVNKIGMEDTENNYKQRTQSNRESYTATDEKNVEKRKKEKHTENNIEMEDTDLISKNGGQPSEDDIKEDSIEREKSEESIPSSMDDVYNIEALMEKKGSNYFVKWENYPEDQNTWEHKASIPTFILQVLSLILF